MAALKKTTTDLERYFEPFKKNIVGDKIVFDTPFGQKTMVYADWTASGRLYEPIEKIISQSIGPLVGNTHTESNVTGTSMTKAYHHAQSVIKDHVNAAPSDVIITTDSGMTGVVNKFQRILGLKIPERLSSHFTIAEEDRPIVFVTHMEHHSNHTSWLETIATVECILPDEDGLIDMNHLDTLLQKYKDREVKIASVTSCSNVTGIKTDYHRIARLMHQHGGLCFVDFACSAPYQDIDMHPEDEDERLDAIYFSPHKFLGGPGSSGVLIFNKELYKNKVPDHVGGGTVAWTNPWGEHQYFDDIEVREDGGTPAFLQTIKAALATRLKEKLGVQNILDREHEIVERVFQGLSSIDNLIILAGNNRNRLGIFSFYIEGLHFNLGVKLMNDRFGIQMRGGCSCAGTYGHFLLHIPIEVSHAITQKIDHGNLEEKPGWIRMSIHPTMSNEEIDFILESLKALAKNHEQWQKDYRYDPKTNEFYHQSYGSDEDQLVDRWFDSNQLL